MSLNLNHLRIFFICGQKLTFSEAADALFLSTPAVTMQMKQFEASLGIDLFQHRKRTIELTETGRILFEHAKNIFKLTAIAENSIAEIKGLKKGDLRIGTLHIYNRYVMSPLISAYQEKYPDIRVSLDEGNSADIIRSLIDRKNDLALITAVDPRLEAIPHFQEELVLALPGGHPLCRKRRISMADLSKEPLLIQQKGSISREFILAKYREAKIEPHIVSEAKNFAFIIEQVEAGKGISFFVKWILKDQLKRGTLKIRPLAEGPFLINVDIAYLKNRILSPAASAFIDLMIERRNNLTSKKTIHHSIKKS